MFRNFSISMDKIRNFDEDRKHALRQNAKRNKQISQDYQALEQTVEELSDKVAEVCGDKFELSDNPQRNLDLLVAHYEASIDRVLDDNKTLSEKIDELRKAKENLDSLRDAKHKQEQEKSGIKKRFFESEMENKKLQDQIHRQRSQLKDLNDLIRSIHEDLVETQGEEEGGRDASDLQGVRAEIHAKVRALRDAAQQADDLQLENQAQTEKIFDLQIQV